MRVSIFTAILCILFTTTAFADAPAQLSLAESPRAALIGPLAPTPATISVCLVPGCDASAFIVKAIDTADSEIRGQTYNFTDTKIVDALVRAHRDRNVDVQVLVDKTTPCEKNSGVDALVTAGIPVAIDKKPRIAHNKVFEINHQRTIEGSFNFSINAMHNAENTNLVESPVVADWYRAQWDRRKEVSTPYTNRADFCKH